MAEAGVKKLKQTTKLTRQDYVLIVQWIEDPDNLIKVEGSEKKVKLGTRPCVKGKGFAELAKYVNDGQKKGSILKEVSGESMRTRYKMFCNRYRAAKAESVKTGFGLTEADIAANIGTVAEKLESLCPCYDHMDAIFGMSIKIRTPGKYDSGINLEGGGQDFPWQQTVREDVVDLTVNAGLDSIVPDLLNAYNEEEVMEALNGTRLEGVDAEDTSVGMEGDAGDDGNEHAGGEVGSPDVREVDPDLSYATRAGSPPQVRPNATSSVDEDVEAAPGDTTPTDRASPPTVEGGRPTRTRSQAFGPEKHYVVKKGLQETRNGINVAFANNLEAISIQKEKANEIRERKYIREVEIFDKRLTWEQQRSIEDRLDKKEERKELMDDRREDRDSRMSIAMVSSGRSIEELQLIWDILKRK